VNAVEPATAGARLVSGASGEAVGTCGTLFDLTENLEIVKTLKRREAVLDAVSFVAGRFLRGANWEAALLAGMERLGLAADAAAVVLTRIVRTTNGDLVRPYRIWKSAASKPVTPEAAFDTLIGPDRVVGRWKEMLERGEIVAGGVDQFTGLEREVLVVSGYRSIAIVPIFVGESHWGDIGFGRSSAVRWAQPILDGLRTAAGIIGAAIEQSEIRSSLVRAHAELENRVLQRTRELSEANRALRESEQLYRTLIDTGPDGIVLAGLDLRVTMVNRRILELFGADSSEQLIGSTATWFARDDDPARVRRVVETLLAEGRVPANELRLTRRDGSTFQAEVSAAVARDGQGKPRHVVAVVRDVTARKQLEEQFRQAQKMEAIGRLAGGIAHDFNNLLTVITGYSELLARRLAGSPAENRKVAQVLKASERAAALVDQLLAFSRKQMVEPCVIAVNGAIADIEKMLRRLIGEDIEFRTFLAPDAGAISVDPSQFDQILMNLVVNARDAIQSGGRLEIATRNVLLEAAPADVRIPIPPGRYVVTEVRDTGIGMDAETRSRLFEPFFTTKEVGRGTGLGLATVYGIVQQTGGSIAVESVPGEGSVFRVYLPAVREDRGPAEREDPVRAPEGTGTILVAEDEDLVRTMIVEALQDAGYRVLEARNGQHAVDVAERHRDRIDLLLSDVVMPRMSGPELAERLSHKLPGLRVLFVSGYIGRQVNAASAFLRKPFTPAGLQAAVRRVLDSPVPCAVPR
jgi:PAS domain S-box-containing protein